MFLIGLRPINRPFDNFQKVIYTAIQDLQNLHILHMKNVTAMPDTTLDIFTSEAPLIQTTSEAPIVKDEYASDDYLDPNARKPKVQFLRGELGPAECGVFIAQKELAAAGWLDYDEKDLVKYDYNSGGQELGLLLKSARVLVSEESVLFAFDRTASRAEGRTVIVGKYDKNIHGDREKYGTGQNFQLLFLDANNNPLHTLPFLTTLKGATQATFGIMWKELAQKVTDCHAKANGIPSKQRDVRFRTLCVFAFTVERAMAGTAAKSPACKVANYEIPNDLNWKSYFLGSTPGVGPFMVELLSPVVNPPVPVTLALAPGDNIEE